MYEPNEQSGLFDFTLSGLVGTRFLPMLYALAVLLSAMTGLRILSLGFPGGPGGTLLTLILAVAVAMVQIILSRIVIELVLMAYRITENTSRMVKLQLAQHEPSDPKP